MSALPSLARKIVLRMHIEDSPDASWPQEHMISGKSGRPIGLETYTIFHRYSRN